MTAVRRWTRTEAEQAAEGALAAVLGWDRRDELDRDAMTASTRAVLDALGLTDDSFTIVAGHLEQVGILIDGTEFVPADIADEHTPFAVLPGTDAAAVYRVVAE